MLSGPGIASDDDPPVRSVTSEAAAVIATLVARGLEQTGDGRFSAAARFPPSVASWSSWRVTHTSWVDIFLMVGRPLGGGGGGAAAMEKPREVRASVER
jgi:hypothetical protein